MPAMIDTDLNDDLSDLIGNGPRQPTAAKPPEGFKPVLERAFEEPCPKCRGTGRWVGGGFYAHGTCFQCNGTGKLKFKTAPEVRAAARTAKANRTVKKADQAVETFKAAHPDVFAWIDGNDFPFAKDMLVAIRKWGDLTDNQMAACQRMIEKRNAEKAEAVARQEAAPVVATEGIDRLKAAFDKAIADAAAKGKGVTLVHPRITIGAMTITRAKEMSNNPGALYVKMDGDYLGKIADGKFFAVRTCTEQQKADVLKFIADPAEAAKAYGQETGVCCICNATLRSEWRLRGIGPICAQKFGW